MNFLSKPCNNALLCTNIWEKIVALRAELEEASSSD